MTLIRSSKIWLSSVFGLYVLQTAIIEDPSVLRGRVYSMVDDESIIVIMLKRGFLEPRTAQVS